MDPALPLNLLALGRGCHHNIVAALRCIASVCYQQGMVEGDVLPRPCTCGILKGGKVFSVPFEGFQDIYI